MDKYVFDLVAFLVGAALVGMVGLLINGLRTEIQEMKEMLRCMVTESLCKERCANMAKDIDNIAEIARNK
jgi:hypothetical protein